MNNQTRYRITEFRHRAKSIREFINLYCNEVWFPGEKIENLLIEAETWDAAAKGLENADNT